MLKAPRGTKDVIPQESYKWQYIENKIHHVCETFGYKEVRVPTFEHTEVFERGVGDTTDVVQKEMYTFEDKGGRSITLRPEGTAGVVRCFLENNLYAVPQPTKMYYLTSCFRYEKPQAGRLREFHQFGIEVFGSPEPSIDAEIISVALTLFRELKIENLSLNINSVGCPSCRAEYNKLLKDYFNDKDLCETCLGRLEKNPMRILDCKSPDCQEIAKNAPRIADYLCTECNEHFETVKTHLDAMDIPYQIDKGIVRGLDYYTKTVFEIISDNIGAQGTVCGGGRYDGLVEELGGKPTSGIGFGMGLERTLLVMENCDIIIDRPKSPDIYVASIGKEADIFSSALVTQLRSQGLVAEREHLGRSVKAQMKYADKLGCRFTTVIGSDEVLSKTIKLKNMQTGEQKTISVDDIVKEVNL